MHGHHGDWASYSMRGNSRVVTQGSSVAQYIIVHRGLSRVSFFGIYILFT